MSNKTSFTNTTFSDCQALYAKRGKKKKKQHCFKFCSMGKKTIELYGFSSVESPDAVKSFLELYTGEGTVCAVEVSQRKAGARAHANVRFKDCESAETVLGLAANRLIWYGDSYLKARELKPKDSLCSMGGIALHFGCRVSKKKFSVLWNVENVCVEFGEGLRKLDFLFDYESVEYKLELSYENIWQIELRCPSGDRDGAKFLLLQVRFPFFFPCSINSRFFFACFSALF